MAKKFIEARVIQKVGTEQEWMDNDLILYEGEIALVRLGDSVINMKVGTGDKAFRDLPYMVIGDVSDYIITPQNTTQELVNLPLAVYRVQGKGTYNLLVSEAVEGVTINGDKTVVAEGYDVKFIKSETGWKVASSVRLPSYDDTALQDRITQVENDVDYLIGESISTSYSGNSYGIITTNGSINTSTTTSDVTDFVPVELGDKLYLTSNSGNGVIALAGYSTNTASASTLVEILLPSGVLYTEKEVVITNPNIKYVVAGGRNSTYTGNTTILNLRKITTNGGRVTELENRVADLESRPLPEVDLSILVDIKGQTTLGRAVRSDTGSLSDLTSVGFPDTEVTDFIDVRGTNKIYVSGWFGSSVGVAGYSESKEYNSRLADTGIASVNRIEYAEDYLLTIPSNVAFIKVSTKDRNQYPLKVFTESDLKDEFIELKSEVENMQTAAPPKIKIEKVSATNFKVSIYNSERKKFVVHNFIRKLQINEVSGVANMVTEDVWYPDSIIVDGNTIAQGNLNFIYMINAVGDKPGENGHVGAGHGCVVTKWIKFYADGKEFDPTMLTEVLNCETFSIKYLADCYAINKPISVSGSNGLPKLDENNNPIVANQHSLDATYYADGRIEHRNRLYIKRDDTSFVQCHAAMNSCYRPYFDKVAFPTQQEFVLNRQYIDEVIVVAEPTGCDFNIITTDRVYSNEVTQFGADNYPYMIKNTIINMDNSKQNNCNLHFYANTQPNWLKVYMQPIICTSNPDGRAIEVFNAGDVIDILVKREVRI